MPARIGRYEVRERLGAGAFGCVYRAFDPELNRDVAIKVPKADALTPELLVRFRTEALAAAAIHHPNVCPIHDVGAGDDGVPFLVMQFVAGGTLDGVLKARKKPYSARDAAAVVRKIALGVAAAHASGVLHRDLKPANVLWNEAAREVLVTDFGLARVAGAAQLSQTGQILGTPAYMSPEQARARPDEIGPLTDVYSLGVILYRLVTGTMPFEGSVLEVLARAQFDEPRPPSEVRPGLDPRIDALCATAMAKLPVDRYPSAKAFADALADFLRGADPERSGGAVTGNTKPGTGTSGPVPLELPGEEPDPDQELARRSAATHRAGGASGSTAGKPRTRDPHPVAGTSEAFPSDGPGPWCLLPQSPQQSPGTGTDTPTPERDGRGLRARRPAVLMYLLVTAGLLTVGGVATVFVLGWMNSDRTTARSEPAVTPPGKVAAEPPRGTRPQPAPPKDPEIDPPTGIAPKTPPKKGNIGPTPKNNPTPTPKYEVIVPPPPPPPVSWPAFPAAPKAGVVYTSRVGVVEMVFCWIPPGTFRMGSNHLLGGSDERPRRVTIARGFWMGQTEVTQAQWAVVMGTIRSAFKGPDCPVEMVSWTDAQQFCQKLTGMTAGAFQVGLPTEAEWEYAARAGETTEFHFGDAIDDRKANYHAGFIWNNSPKGQFLGRTTDVRSFASNAWGLYDIHGNVFEWCQDWYGAYPDEDQTDPSGPPTGTHRVLRGGAWSIRPQFCRVAARSNFVAGKGDDNIGFRVCIRPDGEPEPVAKVKHDDLQPDWDDAQKAALAGSKTMLAFYRERAPGRIDEWKKAALANNPRGMALYSRCLREGIVVAKDEKNAIEWLKRAANLDEPTALNNLGLYYDKGTAEVMKNEKEAAWLYHRAADKGGYVLGMYNLAICYEQGVGVMEGRNLGKAVYWYRRAAEQNYQPARDSLRRLGKE